LADGVEALDGFAYTGGFAANLLAAGAARVTLLDSSVESLAGADHNLQLNAFNRQDYQLLAGDAFVEMRRFRDQGQTFDLIVLDPPKFAPTRAQAAAAARGYKDINLLAFKLLRPGGVLVTFSCSGGIEPDLFQKIVADAALDARVEAVIVGWLSQPADHPVALRFPEGRYLKGLVCRTAS
jgi:23S rRNA (cytosine1962-C5)-methyltransferase